MKLRLFSLIFILSFISPFSILNAASSSQNETIPLAMGYGKLTYSLPRIGSYQLPSLGKASNGQILDEHGRQRSLHDIYSGKFVLLSFIYSNCSDINGCPLSSNVNYKLKIAMQNDPLLADNLRLVSLSFDPERDKPEVMRLYGENFKYAGNKGEWNFLTTSSMRQLTPILNAYNQDIQREKSVNGQQEESISHILRVFLIDPENNIRNIYSVAFLHSDLILSDVKTLLLAREIYRNNDSESNIKSVLSKPGDNKEGYSSPNYQTQSNSLAEREGKGRAADFMSIAQNPPLGLPQLPNKMLSDLSIDKILLGRKLFYDRRLSLNDTFSCAMCHIPEQGFTSNEVAMAVGIEGRSVRRNSPTLYNIAYATKLFHDGRENDLEQQPWGPLLAKNEMGNPSIGYVIEKIKKIKGYDDLFDTAFDNNGINMLTVGQAFAAYQRVLLSADSLFDRWYYGKQKSALSEAAKKGFKLFTGKAQCVVCHKISKTSALFSDNKLHNTGQGYYNSMGIKPPKQRVFLAPGVYIDVDREIIDAVGKYNPGDLGLYEITEDPFDRWKYKTPTLRNISLTAPYMHNGSMSTLKEVVQFYNKGGVKNKNLSPLIKPLGLSTVEIENLIKFLDSLTGSNVDTLIADAFVAPVGDLIPADPNWANNERPSDAN